MATELDQSLNDIKQSLMLFLITTKLPTGELRCSILEAPMVWDIVASSSGAGISDCLIRAQQTPGSLLSHLDLNHLYFEEQRKLYCFRNIISFLVYKSKS